jgi:antitoxin MazE
MKIVVDLRKWVNSIGLRIPAQVAEILNVRENSPVSLNIDGDRLIVEKAVSLPSLDEILDSIPQNFSYPEDITEFVDTELVGEEQL